MHIPQGLSDSLISGYLGCFHVLVIVNNAAVNKDVEISVPECAFNSLGTASKVELLDHKVLTFLYPVMEKMFTYGAMRKSFGLIQSSAALCVN